MERHKPCMANPEPKMQDGSSSSVAKSRGADGHGQLPHEDDGEAEGESHVGDEGDEGVGTAASAWLPAVL